MKPIDYIVIGLLAVIVAVIIFTLIRNKKKGKSSCGCDCANCSGCSSKQNVSEKTNK